MKSVVRLIGVAALGVVAVTSCSTDDVAFNVASEDPSLKINLAGEITQVYNSRVNDNGFCDGDKVGIYVVDYEGDKAGTLKPKGNRADNVGHTFNEAAGVWDAAYDLYFRDNKTNVDIYGYYPFAAPDDMGAYQFELEKDQSTSAAEGQLGGYEASDFLWGKAEKVAPSERVISVAFRHVMASARVTLAEGTGFDAGEWASIEKSVLMMNTTRTSTINLSTGAVTATGDVPSTGTIPYSANGDYRSIIVPQTVAAGKTLAMVTVGGTPYQFKKDEAFTYSASKQHNFTITVNKRIGSGYEFVLTSESITAWENDGVSHDATAREYIVVNVAEPGTLAECIASAGKDLAQVQNLKLTGQITAKDFSTMRENMPKLRALNLKEVVIKGGEGCEDDEIPSDAFSNKKNLTSIVLPEKLKTIGTSAFYRSGLLGSLVIPEGVERVLTQAFRECTGLSGNLYLPSSLLEIGDQAFLYCHLSGTLTLPNELKVIGDNAFMSCNFTGDLRLPESLSKVGESAFSSLSYLSGSLTIPQSLTEIPNRCFFMSNFGGLLYLHDGVTFIGEGAFNNCI